MAEKTEDPLLSAFIRAYAISQAAAQRHEMLAEDDRCWGKMLLADANRAGYSYATLAGAVGLSRARVQQLVEAGRCLLESGTPNDTPDNSQSEARSAGAR